MSWTKIRYSFGLAGVSNYETLKAKHWGQIFEWPMVLLAIWIPFQWYLEHKLLLSTGLSSLADWLVWWVFVTETVVITGLVGEKKRYLKQNWMNLLIIVVGFPLFWQVVPLAAGLRGLRLLVLLGVMLRLGKLMQKVLHRNTLGTTVLVSLIVIVLSGLLMSFIDPAIQTPFDGIWWAWVTVTTVGYGDLVPVSTLGRLFGGFLILLGVGLFALLTANFSAALIGREVEQEVEELEAEESEILKKLVAIERRLDQIETRLRER